MWMRHSQFGDICTGAAESRQIRLPALSNRTGWRAAASAMFCLLKPRLTWQSHWPAAACPRLPCTWRRAWTWQPVRCLMQQPK